MKLDELKKSLRSKLNGRGIYFDTILFKYEEEYFKRRSFDDLFKYYKRRGVTEKLLLQALYEEGFSALVCGALKKVVFFKYYAQKDTFWGDSSFGYDTYKVTKNTKYTAKYLDNLFKTIY